MAVDIETLSTSELKEDLHDSYHDIGVCEVALAQGVTSYSGGSVEKRLCSNRHFVSVITKELSRRGGG